MHKGFKKTRRNKPTARLRALRLGAVLVVMGAASAVSCGGVNDPEPTAELEQMLGSPVTVSFQDGVLPTSAYAGTTDSSIKQATATTNFGTATSLEADGDDGGGVDKSALVKWTLSGIPAGSIVQSASITLRTIDETNNTPSGATSIRRSMRPRYAAPRTSCFAIFCRSSA